MDTQFALSSFKHSIALADGDIHHVAKTCAHGFVDAFVQCYNIDEAPSLFFVCGTGFNGLVGLYAAAELKRRAFEPAVYAVKESRHINIHDFCSEQDIPFYDFVPSTLEFYFQVVIDALLGLGFDGGDIRPEFWDVYGMLVSTRCAIASVDVPSGWDLETGPRKIDFTADTFVKPELLVSLGAPKNGSKMFAGGFHFIAGRHLPHEYLAQNGIEVPLYPGSYCHSVLFSSNPFRYQENGSTYGKLGQYNATLYTKNPKRTWVDIDDDMDLWDELD